MELHPTRGGRVILDRVDDRDDAPPGLRYRAAIYTPDTLHRGAAEISPDGAVSFAAWDPPSPPAWLVDFARSFLRSEWRARAGKDDPPPWPARLSRWRDVLP